MRGLLLVVAAMFYLACEVMRLYWIMPFPGSQPDAPGEEWRLALAYWFHSNIWWLRLVALALGAWPLYRILRDGRWFARAGAVVLVILCVAVGYLVRYELMADRMFRMPQTMNMASVSNATGIGEMLVLVVGHGPQARAYPIEIIGYHHQVFDTVAGRPVLITYCTVCRTGRAWEPMVNGLPEKFRLVGMDHFNAMFEDSRTGSWWRQATGECVAGTLKGQRLTEVFSRQMTLSEFLLECPSGAVMQPDPTFVDRYAGLEGFDEGSIDSHLERRDTSRWQPKSWVLGVQHGAFSRAYDWNELSELGTLSDTLGGDTIVIRLAEDGATFHVEALGRPVQAYQEFWHSWRTFHPLTTRYGSVD